MLLLSLITTIVTLLWSVQFFTTIHSESVLIWLNLIMIITWITLLIHFIHDHIYPKDYTFKNSSTKYTELTHIEEKEDIENKLPTTIE